MKKLAIYQIEQSRKQRQQNSALAKSISRSHIDLEWVEDTL